MATPEATSGANLRPAPPRAPAIAFVAVLIVGVLGTLVNPALSRAPAADVWSGRWASAYQAALDAASPLRPVALAAWNALDLALFRQAPAGVLLGRDGWLFTEEEYDLPVDATSVRSAWVTQIVDVADRLAREDVRLVVALVPAKAGQVAARPHPLPALAATRYDATLADLTAHGVATVDLRPALVALGDAAWLRTDTHWTPEGARAAATAIAAEVARLAPGLPADDGFETVDLGVEAFHGDLAGLLALGPLADRLGPAPDQVERTETRSTAPQANDLFASVELPVTVVGTSYAADPRWNLADRLRVTLGQDVLDVARTGIGPLRPMLEYLSGDAWAQQRPQVVIWEVPVRYLTDDTYLDADGSR
jgi:alginate O-acetyltransferase complex protein AlgJ